MHGIKSYFVNSRRAEFGMLEEPHMSINVADIMSLIRQMHYESPTLGVSMVSGRLRARGFNVSKDRLRRLMRENDPLSVALHWPGGVTNRRPYSVPWPNSLWHIDMIILIEKGALYY